MDATFWETIDLSKTKKKKVDIGKVSVNYIFPEYGIVSGLDGTVCVGVDPGVNFGITLLTSDMMAVLWGKLLNELNLPGLESMQLGSRVVLDDTPWSMIFNNTRKLVIRVEGAAFSERFGQPLLEQIRFGFAYGLAYKTLKWPIDVEYLQPNSARLQAFGHGERAGKDLWPNLNQNAADSIGLAIAAAKTVAD